MGEGMVGARPRHTHRRRRFDRTPPPCPPPRCARGEGLFRGGARGGQVDKSLCPRVFSIRGVTTFLWIKCACFRIAAGGEIARVRPMNEIAPGTNLLPDADAAGAPGLRPGTTGI